MQMKKEIGILKQTKSEKQLIKNESKYKKENNKITTVKLYILVRLFYREKI